MTNVRVIGALAALALAGCKPNLIVRNATVEWTATTKVARAEVANVGDKAAGEFLVYFDGEENPVSANHRPQVQHKVVALAAGAAVPLVADFAPLAHPDNANLANVRAIRITADPKGAVAEKREDDNVAVVDVPAPPQGCTPAASAVATGTPGSMINGQSFNETRAVDVTVLGSTARVVEKMVLRGLNVGGTSNTAIVGARIYDSTTQALVGSAAVTVAAGVNQTVEVPIDVPLAAAKAYRIGFSVRTSPVSTAGSGSFFVPSGFTSPTSETPYNESSGVFRVNSAHGGAIDAFPGNPNMFVVQMTIVTRCP